MKRVLERYFELWRAQDAQGLLELFSEDAAYAVHPFDEIYRGQGAIAKYLAANTVAKLRNPHPKILAVGYGNNRVFAEWEMTYERVSEGDKIMRGCSYLNSKARRSRSSANILSRKRSNSYPLGRTLHYLTRVCESKRSLETHGF